MTSKIDLIYKQLIEDIPFDGWYDSTIIASAKRVDVCEAELTSIAGNTPLCEFFIDIYIDHINESMKLAAKSTKFNTLKIRERIAFLLNVRFEYMNKQKLFAKRTSEYLFNPINVFFGKKQLWNTANLIWRIAGDASVDYNYYTKRLLLSGVYSSSLLFWLQDQSDDLKNTSEFIDRRIDNIMLINQAKFKAKNWYKKISHEFLKI